MTGAISTRALTKRYGATLGVAALFAVVGYLQPVEYRRFYPTLSDRLGFARSFAPTRRCACSAACPGDLLGVGG